MKKVSAVAMAPLAPLAPGAGFLFPFRIISSAMVEIFDSECREPLRPQSLHRRLSSNTCMRLRENPSHSENLDSGVRVAVYLFVPSCGTDGVLFEGLMAPNRINYLTHAPPRRRRRHPPCLCQTSSPAAAPDANAPFGKTILVQSVTS